MQGPPPLVIALIVIASIVFWIAVGAGALRLFRTYENRASRSLMRHYEGIELHAEMQPGDVFLTYHTYHGVLAWYTQTPHRAILPADDARRLLGRLLRHNLMWGWLAAGGVFVIPLAIGNYLAQRRSIARQEAAQADQQYWSQPIGSQEHPGRDDNPYAPPKDDRTPVFAAAAEQRSNVRRILGWTTALLAVIFAGTAIAGLASAEFETAIGGLVLAVFLGAVARNWIRGRPIE